MRNVLELLTAQSVGDWEIKITNNDIQLIEHRQGLEYCWMANSIWEMGTHKELQEKAFGRVMIGGLGLGYDSLLIEEKESVTAIDIVEMRPEIIQMVAAGISHPKVNVMEDRVKHYLETCSVMYDTIWFDIFSKDACSFQKLTDELTALASTKLNPGGVILFWHDHDPIKL